MGIISMLIVAGSTVAFVIILLIFLFCCLIAGIAEGFFVSHMGKRLQRNEAAVSQSPQFIAVCRYGGLISAIVCIATIPAIILALVLSSSVSAPLVNIAFFMTDASFVLLLVLGILLIGISRLNKKVDPPPVHKVASVVFLIVGILTLIAGAICLWLVISVHPSVV